jgi:SPP1 gp7 family putative phage head morphogenesis protein
MIQLAKKRIVLGMMSGESYDEVAKDLQKMIPANAHRRIPVMVRDQSSRIYQESTKACYIKHKKLIKEFRWEGPLDNRTTPICRARQENNPYTLEQMERMNPHPHVQCRHRWVAVVKE